MVSRREFVVGGGAVAATAGMAGCDRLPFGETARYAEWSPARGREEVYITATRPAEMAAVEDVSGADRIYHWEVDPEEVDLQLWSYSGWTVTEGDLSVADVEYAFDSLESAGTYAGYDRYHAGPTDPEVAFDDGTVVTGESVDVLEAVVDAEEGDGERLVDENDDVGTVHDVVGDGDAVHLWTYPEPEEHDGEVAYGMAFDFAEGQSDVVVAFVFRGSDAVDEERIREKFENDETVTEFSLSRDGRVLEINASIETSEY